MARLGGEGVFIVREFIQPGSVLVVQGGLAYVEAAPKGAPTLKTQSSRRRLGPITQAFRKRGSTRLNWLGKMQDVFASRSRQQRSSMLMAQCITDSTHGDIFTLLEGNARMNTRLGCACLTMRAKATQTLSTNTASRPSARGVHDVGAVYERPKSIP